jgi:hypothetical protein
MLLTDTAGAAESEPEPKWIELKPLRPGNYARSKVVNDIESQLWTGHPYRDSDLMTWAHEGTHGVNSRIRRGKTGEYNGFYCLNNRAVLLPEPKGLTLRQVFAKIPDKLPQLASVYVQNGLQYWNNEPLYLFDEWVSYTSGMEVVAELNIPDQGTRKFVMEFARWCYILGKMVNNNDLNIFYNWNRERMLRLLGRESEVFGAISPAIAPRVLV